MEKYKHKIILITMVLLTATFTRCGDKNAESKSTEKENTSYI